MDSILRAAIKTSDGETRHTNVWQATLRRQGQRLSRTFAEARWGRREAALVAAQAWRDAVIAAIPPITNHRAATRFAARNATGISGVSRSEPEANPGEAMWIATLTTGGRLKRRAFSVSAYGEDGARARSIARRQKWLNQLPPRYHSMCETSRAALDQLPAPTIAQSVAPVPLLSPKEIKDRIAVINADFDARMPKRLRWRVRAQNAAKPNGPIVVVISDTCSPPRRHTHTASPRGRPLHVMLAEARDRLHADAANLHGKDIADWFIRTHITPAFNAELFDPIVSVRSDRPTVLISMAADHRHG